MKNDKDYTEDLPNLDKETLILASEICEKQKEVLELQRMQMIIAEFNNAVDYNLLEFIGRYSDGKNKDDNWSKFEICAASDKQIEAAREILHVDISNYTNVIKPNTVRHIEARHGEHGEQDKSMADIKNISRVQYVLENFDSAKQVNETFADYKNKDNTPSVGIEYSKRINGTIYVVEVIPDTNNKLAYIKTMYIKKAELEKQAPHDNQKSGLLCAEYNEPPANVRNEHKLPTKHSIPQTQKKVKRANKKKEDVER